MAARAAAGQQGGRTRWRLLGWAVLLSLALHVVVLAVISVGQGRARRAPAPAAVVDDDLLQPGALPALPVEIALVDVVAPGTVTLNPAEVARLPLRTGPVDSDAEHEQHPFPRSDVEAPDVRAAGAGGGDAGGRPAFTGRSDPGDDAMSVVVTTGADVLRAEHTRTGATRRSPETIRQEPQPGLADTRGAGRGQRGPLLPRTGSDAETRARAASGQGGDDDPMIARGTSTSTGGPAPADVAAARTRSAGGAAPVEPGPRATETERRGATSDDLAAAEASDNKRPGVIERTPPSAGGDADKGVAGTNVGTGTSAKSTRETSGQGGTRADVPVGADPALRARRVAQTTYLRNLRQRVDRTWRYPDALRIALEQGSAIVHITLRARDGALLGVRFVKRSRFPAFDAEVQRAVKAAAPFGAVPPVLTRGSEFVLAAPFEYENPLIR
ncbi:MAG: TonB family protein [Deltaproteobacteria bacterium]|nr:TonB family protein [Deltaproteobacteria bacterium]